MPTQPALLVDFHKLATPDLFIRKRGVKFIRTKDAICFLEDRRGC